MSNAADIAAAIRRCRSFLISVHVNPDGDGLGAQLALMLSLEKLNKKVVSQNLDPVPDVYRFLPAADRIRSGKAVDGRYDAIVVLDSEPHRTGLFNCTYPADTLINIDHHITNDKEWTLTWLDDSASATGEMVYELVNLLGTPLDRDIALCLYTSIFTDTGSFRYTNTTPKSMRIAADLLQAGADPWLVTENVYESYAFERLKLLGKVLGEMERSEDGRVAWVVVTDELYRQTGTTAEDTDNFVNFVRSSRGVEVAVLFRQTGASQFKISLRSKGRVDLSGTAQTLGGGGHKNAAGSTLDGTLEQVKERVIGEVSKAIESQLGSAPVHGRRS